MMVSDEDLKKLSDLIIANIKEDFAIKHMSKNLINTIQVTQLEGEIQISIPAQTYNMLLFQQKGVVVHTSHGSYANKLNEEGSSFMIYRGNNRERSFRINPGNHKGYIEKSITDAIQIWQSEISKKFKIISKEGI